MLRAQAKKPAIHPLDLKDERLLEEHRIRREGGEVTVTVPEDASEPAIIGAKLARDSTKVQALLAKIGATMGFKGVDSRPGPRRCPA